MSPPNLSINCLFHGRRVTAWRQSLAWYMTQGQIWNIIGVLQSVFNVFPSMEHSKAGWQLGRQPVLTSQLMPHTLMPQPVHPNWCISSCLQNRQGHPIFNEGDMCDAGNFNLILVRLTVLNIVERIFHIQLSDDFDKYLSYRAVGAMFVGYPIYRAVLVWIFH